MVQSVQQSIKKSLEKISPLPEKQVEMLAEKIVVVPLKKNDYFVKPGKVCDFAAVVLKGSLRLFRRENDREHTLHFFGIHDWLTDRESFVAQRPSENYIRAMEDTELAVITIYDIHELIRIAPCFLMLGRVMEHWSVASSLYTTILNQSPDERYKKLLQLHPDWVMHFPQMYIASYLGMTQETLSRVRKRMANGKKIQNSNCKIQH